MFIQLALLLTATDLLAASPFTGNVQELGNGRIYGGTETSIEEVPWQISLRYYGEHICGGSIYSSKIIVTAAHCVAYKNRRHLGVRYGSSSRISGGTIVGVSAISVHDNYSTSRMINDVGLLLLSWKIEFSELARAIPLATSVPEPGETVVVSGWGYAKNNYEPIILQSVEVKAVAFDDCARAYGRLSITKEMLCAAAPGKDSCQGDSGGPLVHDNQLVGIVSFGIDCALPKYPGVYTNVPELRTWIELTATKMQNRSKKLLDSSA